MKIWTSNKIRHVVFVFLFIINVISYSVLLSNVEGLNKLPNYDELRNIETNRIVDRTQIKRNQQINKVFVIGENKPFTGIAIKKENGKILGIYSYEDGKANGLIVEYYKSGDIAYIKREYKEDIVIKSIAYYKNGKIFRTFKSTGGMKGIIDATNKQGYRTVTEVIQDYSIKKRIEYIWDGYAKVYDKSGKMIADMNFKQNKMMGLPQKLYKDGKLKYYMVAASNDPDNFDVQDFYKEYYDNSEQIRIDCEEVSKGEWSCKEYAKNGSLKREFQSPKYKLKEDTSLGWNMVLGILNILLYTH